MALPVLFHSFWSWWAFAVHAEDFGVGWIAAPGEMGFNPVGGEIKTRHCS